MKKRILFIGLTAFIQLLCSVQEKAVTIPGSQYRITFQASVLCTMDLRTEL